MTKNDYLKTVRNPAGEKETFEYSKGQVTSATDPKGNKTTFTYGKTGLLTKITDPSGDTTTLSRSFSGNKQTVTVDTPGGRTDEFSISASPTGVRFENATTGVTTLVDLGKTKTTYPGSGTIETQTGASQRFGKRAPVVNAVETTTPSGLVQSITATQSVKLADQDDPLSVESWRKTVGINGKKRREHYTDSSDALKTTFPTGRWVERTLGTGSRVTTVDISDRTPTEYEYDSEGHLIARRQTAGTETREWSATYDGNGFRNSVTDPRGEQLSIDRDDVGRPTTVSYPDGTTLKLAYDDAGNLTSITPPGKSKHTFNYTADGYPDTYSPPDTSDTWSYSFDGDGYLTRVDPPSGNTIAASFDKKGHMTMMSLPRGTISRKFDSKSGNLSKLSGPDGNTLKFSFDGPLPVEDEFQGAIAGTVSRSFDDSFRLSELSVNGTNSISYDYDDGFLTNAGACSISNGPGGRLTKATVGSVTQTWTQGAFDEIDAYEAKSGGSTLYRADYQRNERGWITKLTETVDGSTTTRTFTYDETGQLTAVHDGGSVVEKYAYDGNGNRTTVERAGSTTHPKYDERDRLTSAGDLSYSYDADGFLTKVTDTAAGETTTYDYDAIGNLMSVDLPGGTTVEYDVDPAGRRIGKRVGGTLQRGWLYRDGLRPVAEVDSQGSVVTRFVYGTNEATPDYMIKNGTKYTILTDQVGSPRLVVDASTGQIEQRMDYDAFGRVTNDTNPGFQPFGFAGGLYDPDTGLVQFGMRDYDPRAGRFTAGDPIAFSGGTTNLYAYANNNPVNVTDRSGQFVTFLARGAVGGAIGGGVETTRQLITYGEVRNWSSVGVASAEGAATGMFGPEAGALAETATGTLLAESSVDVVGGIGGTVANNAIAQARGDCVNLTDGVATSAITTASLGVLGGSASNKLDDIAKVRKVKGLRAVAEDQVSNDLAKYGDQAGADAVNLHLRPSKNVTRGIETGGKRAVDVATESTGSAIRSADTGTGNNDSGWSSWF